MHTYKIPLKTTCHDEKTLNKVYWWMFKLHNQVVSFAKKCFRKLNSNKEYHLLLKEYHKLKKIKNRTSVQETRRKEIGKALNKIQESIGLSKIGLEKFVKVQQKKYSKYISSQQAQKEADRVWEGVSKVLYSNGKKLHYKKATNFRTITGKSPENGIKFRGDHILYGDLEIPCKLEHSDYEKESLNHDLKYCELVREKFNSGYRFYVNLYLDGNPPVKYKIGEGTIGIDPGVSTEAVVAKDKLILEELAPDFKKYNKKIANLQRKTDRSVRIMNPNNYNLDGTLRSCKKEWRYSSNYKHLKWKTAVAYRKKSNYIKHSNNALANKIIQHGRRFFIESMNFKALAKKAKKIEKPKNEEERCKRRKRYGSSMNNRAPAQIIETIKRKVTEQNGSVYRNNALKCKASQFNHHTGEYEKTELNSRTKIVNGHKVQRDLYSAFLFRNSEITLDRFNIEYCNIRFEDFIKMHDELIAEMKQNGVSMKQCFGF